jgi:CBS domain-containing protein
VARVLCPSCDFDNIPGVDSCESCGSNLAGLDLPAAHGGFRGKLLTDRIADMGFSEPVTVEPSTTVKEAILAMRRSRSGCILVEESGKLKGLFNERHVLTRVLRKDRDPETTRVSEVMSPNPLQLSPNDPPAFAVHCMVAYGFRHLPVVSGGELLGVVSVRNILRFLDSDVLRG